MTHDSCTDTTPLTSNRNTLRIISTVSHQDEQEWNYLRVLQVLHHCIHWIDPLFSGAYSVICHVFDDVACLVTLAVSDGVHAVTSQVQRLTSPHRHLSQELHCSFTECHSNINFSSQEYILCQKETQVQNDAKHLWQNVKQASCCSRVLIFGG